MPPSPDFRARTNELLDTARDDDTIVVACAAPDGALLMQTRSPTARGLVAIARALLTQASDELDHVNASGLDVELVDMVGEALAILPDNADEHVAPK